jgi:hypothetical protein
MDLRRKLKKLNNKRILFLYIWLLFSILLLGIVAVLFESIIWILLYLLIIFIVYIKFPYNIEDKIENIIYSEILVPKLKEKIFGIEFRTDERKESNYFRNICILPSDSSYSSGYRNIIKGMYHNLYFTLANFTITETYSDGERTYNDTLFEGLWLSIKTKYNFNGSITIVRKGTSTIVEEYYLNYALDNSNLNEKMKDYIILVKDIDINEVKNIITDDLIDMIDDFRNTYKKELYVVFTDDEFCIGIPNREKRFTYKYANEKIEHFF